MALWYWLVLAAAFAVIEIAVPAMVCIWLAAAALGTARPSPISIGARRSMSAGHSPSSARSSMAEGGLGSTTRCGLSKDPTSRRGLAYR